LKKYSGNKIVWIRWTSFVFINWYNYSSCPSFWYNTCIKNNIKQFGLIFEYFKNLNFCEEEESDINIDEVCNDPMYNEMLNGIITEKKIEFRVNNGSKQFT
jgi:hypothetical protein